MKEIDLEAGENIGRACERLAREAPSFMLFNDVRVEASLGDTAGDLEARWSAEMDRKRREYEASDLYKQRQAEDERRAVEERRGRDEALKAVAGSGVRDRHPWSDSMGEISGFGGGYENACRDMLYAGLAWLQAKPDADLSASTTDDAKALEKAMVAACPDCSGAMYGATTNAVLFIAKNGWDEYVRRMTKRTAESA